MCKSHYTNTCTHTYNSWIGETGELLQHLAYSWSLITDPASALLCSLLQQGQHARDTPLLGLEGPLEKTDMPLILRSIRSRLNCYHRCYWAGLDPFGWRRNNYACLQCTAGSAQVFELEPQFTSPRTLKKCVLTCMNIVYSM